MFVIKAPCYTCDRPINIAVIQDDLKDRNSSICGLETLSEEEIKILQSHDVIIKKQYLYTINEKHWANTCPHCNEFIGQNYLFLEYFIAALRGDYKYKVIDII